MDTEEGWLTLFKQAGLAHQAIALQEWGVTQSCFPGKKNLQVRLWDKQSLKPNFSLWCLLWWSYVSHVKHVQSYILLKIIWGKIQLEFFISSCVQEAKVLLGCGIFFYKSPCKYQCNSHKTSNMECLAFSKARRKIGSLFVCMWMVVNIKFSVLNKVEDRFLFAFSLFRSNWRNVKSQISPKKWQRLQVECFKLIPLNFQKNWVLNKPYN